VPNHLVKAVPNALLTGAIALSRPTAVHRICSWNLRWLVDPHTKRSRTKSTIVCELLAAGATMQFDAAIWEAAILGCNVP
jgi:hypothetical protein